MRYSLLLICLISCTSLFGQENLISNSAFQRTPVNQEVYSDNETLILGSFNSDLYGNNCLLRKFSENNKLEKQEYVRGAVASKIDADGNIYLLSTQGFDYDVPLDPYYFAFSKYNRDLELVYESLIDTIANPGLYDAKGNFEILGEEAMIFFKELRIDVDLETGVFTEIRRDTPSVDAVSSCEQLTDSTFVVLSGDLHIMDGNGLLINSQQSSGIFDLIKKNDLIYAVGGSRIQKLDNQLNLIAEISANDQIVNINLDHDGKIYVSTASALLLVDDSNFTTTLVYENDYHDIIWGGYTFKNDLGIATLEDEPIIDQFNGFSAHGVRKAEPIVIKELPNIAVLGANLKNQRLDFDYVVDTQRVLSYYLDFELEVENTGTTTITDLYIQVNGDCDFWQSFPNFCDGDKLEGLNILPNTTETIAVNNIYGHEDIESAWLDGYDVCFSIINVNHSYDMDYLNNFTCKTFEISTGLKNEEALNVSLDIFPNPVKEKLNFKIEGEDFENLNYQIYQATGKLMQSEELINMNLINYSIDVSNLNSGMYFLKLTDEKGRSVAKKFMKLN